MRDRRPSPLRSLTPLSSNRPNLRLLVLACTLLTNPLFPISVAEATGQPFVEIESGLPPVGRSAVAFGDYDNDNDLDVLMAGSSSSGLIAAVYQNDGSGGFSSIGAALEPVQWASAEWGDYDNDGDLDILLAGRNDAGSGTTNVYRNDGIDGFTNIGARLTGVSFSSVSWGDYDNDGDLDILCSGHGNDGSPLTRIYGNEDGDFKPLIDPPGVWFSSTAWGDYDKDGDLDILLTGRDAGGTHTARVLRNDDLVFTETEIDLTGVFTSSGTWGDYDADGDLDILLSGQSAGKKIAEIYRNVGGHSFRKLETALIGVDYSSSAWGDYDNDGDLDALLVGEDSNGKRTARIYNHVSSRFGDIRAPLHGVFQSAVAWGDVDNDGDLDVLLTGRGDDSEAVTKLYENRTRTTNERPTPPAALSATWTLGDEIPLIEFSWSDGSDEETPRAGLSYNLRVGSTPGGDEISAAMSSSDGHRRIHARGNAGHSHSWKLRVKESPIYWSVQTIDSAKAGSAFATEEVIDPGLRTFRETETTLPGMRRSTLAWGDYDGDGDLDLLMAGQRHLLRHTTKIFRNDGPDAFTDIGASIIGVELPAAKWGDYDNDGDLDILLAGMSSSALISKIYRNDGGSRFSDINASLTGVFDASAEWGDYDNDGDLDVLLTGHDGLVEVSAVYRNEGNDTFKDVGAGLVGTSRTGATWVDYDSDGDLDIVLVGSRARKGIVQLYRNEGASVFSKVDPPFSNERWHSAEWGDYDNDGDIDVLLGGASKSSVFLNHGDNRFDDLGPSFPGATDALATWGDYDNDGDLDVLVVSEERGSLIRNDGGSSITDLGLPVPGLDGPAGTWGDYDNDGDLDILLSGGGGTEIVTRLFENLFPPPNSPPGRPNASKATWSGSSRVTLSWETAEDVETPSPGLSYNLRIGTTPGGSEITSAMANASDGYRHVPAPGNANQARTRTIETSSSPIYWSVQSIDSALAGSRFSPEQVTSPDTTTIPEAVPFTTLSPPLPNPSRFNTMLSFALPTAGRVDLAIYDTAGRRVRTLESSLRAAGRHETSWDGEDERGEAVAPGVYFARLRAGAVVKSQRLIRVP